MKLLHLQNMKLVIFDFDGTIADTSLGILDSHKYTLKTMGRIVPPENELRKVIGGNLLKVYMDEFDFSEEKAREAVRIYRERYAEVGIHQATLYLDFKEILEKLEEKEYKIGIATLKAERFAKIMVQEMGIAEYFDEICGMDPNDGLDKAGLILKCCELCDCKRENTVLVGDSNNDLLGSQQAGVNFVGVTYGFGFSKNEQYDFPTVGSCQEFIECLAESNG